MSFVQFKLDKVVDQTRGIFNQYIYDPSNGDSSTDVSQTGYWLNSRFINDADWNGSVIEAELSDGHFVIQVSGGDSAIIWPYITVEEKEAIDELPKLHFGLLTFDTIAVGTDPDNPTYITGSAIIPTASPEFELIDTATGLVRNNSDRALSMSGSITYQLAQGGGGAGELILWTEISDDDGVSFTENPFSLRTSEVDNNSTNSQTKGAGADRLMPGESIRWAMYNSAGGAITLDGPTATVNGGNIVEGLPFFWQLRED